MIECTPHELLPIIPPRVQRSCEAGSGAKVKWCFSAALRRWSRITPGCTRATRRAGFPRQRNSRDHIISVAGQHDSDRHLTIIRPVSGVERAAARVEAHFAAKMPAQSRFEPSRIYLSSFSCMGEFGKVLGHPEKQIPRGLKPARNDNFQYL